MQNDWGQHDIINKIKILTKRGTYMIHVFIPTKYQNYPSTKILKHANIMSKENKLSYRSLPNIAPHDACSIIMHMRTVNLADISQ